MPTAKKTQRRRDTAILLWLFRGEKDAFDAAASSQGQTTSEWIRLHLRAAARRAGKKIQNS